MKPCFSGTKQKGIMHILLTNDDGILAPGLFALYDHLIEFAKVTVVAPQAERSGASHSITLKPIHCEWTSVHNKFEGFAVTGSPADCVKLAVRELISDPVDMVVSGMNFGANVGVNICYSGTVAAALEAGFYGIPSFALSAAYEDDLDFARAAEYAVHVFKQLLPPRAGEVININVPRLSHGLPRGVQVVPQSTHGFEEFYALQSSENNRKIYQINGGSHKDHPDHETDTNLLNQGYITVTALQFNMTNYGVNKQLQSRQWDIDIISAGEKHG